MSATVLHVAFFFLDFCAINAVIFELDWGR